jgi:hypothetical protein
MLKRIAHYIEKYPARLAGYLSAIILNVTHLVPTFPIGLFVPTAMILIMLGEGSQRMEDEKTLRALYTENDPNKPDADILLEIAESAGRGKK